MKKFATAFLLIFFALNFFAFAQEEDSAWPRLSNLSPKEELEIFRAAYPWCQFELGYDSEVKDWTLTVTSYKKTAVLYRAEGLYLPKKELANRGHYWRVIYKYNRTLDNPANFNKKKRK